MTQPQILIVQTKAAAEAASAILGLPAHTAIGFDWASLHGRRVILWPSNTALSLAAFRANLAACWSHGAEQVKLIQPGPLDHAGWDAHAAQRDGWDRDTLIGWLRDRTEIPEPPESKHGADDGLLANGHDTAAPNSPDIRTDAQISGHLPAESGGAEFDPSSPLTEQWAMLGLEQTKAGVVANEDTVLRVLERHPNLQGLVWYDEFLGRIMTPDGDGAREWADADDGRLLAFLQRDLGIARARLNHVRTAVITRAFAQMRNCVREWLESLKWDQTERISHFFQDFCGTPDTPYTRAVSRNFWLTLVARAVRPGCKVDNMIVLEGKQGDGKSSMLEAIAGKAWFTVQHESVTGKGFFEVLQGKLLVEIAEMDAFGKAEVTRVKQVVSTPSDRYRESYGRYAKDHPRSSVFAGTTNKDDWNRDETGARRFWPIRVDQAIDIPAVAAARPQLFAEAVEAFLAREPWWEMPEDETRAEQDARREEDVWAERIGDWLVDIYRQEVTTEQVLTGAIQLRPGEQGKFQQMRAAIILRDLGWRKKNTGGRRFWERPQKTA